MTSPFDAGRLVRRFVHEDACGLEHDFDAADCLAVDRPAAELLARLRAGGIGVVPLESVGWLEQAFAELVEKLPEEEAASAAPWWFEELNHGQVRLRTRMADGRIVRGELVPHYQAVVDLVALNRDHPPGSVSAIIEDEADWIKDLLNRGDSAGEAAA